MSMEQLVGAVADQGGRMVGEEWDSKTENDTREGHWFTVPRRFTVTMLPPDLQPYVDDVHYLLHTIVTLQSQRKMEGRFVPLRVTRLRDVMRKHKEKDIRDWLSANEVIEIDRFCVWGSKSMKYRLCPGFDTDFHEVQCTDTRVIEKLNRLERDRKSPVDHADADDDTPETVEQHLRKQLRRVTVNRRHASRIINKVRKDGDEDKADRMERSVSNIIKRGCRRFTRDDHGRVYTQVVSLHRESRASLRVDGEKLWKLDVAAMQPFQLGCLILKRREILEWVNRVVKDGLDNDDHPRSINSLCNSLPALVRQLLNTHSLNYMAEYCWEDESGKWQGEGGRGIGIDPLAKALREPLFTPLSHVGNAIDFRPDESLYIRLVCSDQFYPHLRSIYQRVTGMAGDKLKQRFFRKVFHCEKPKTLNGIALRFAETFPHVWSYLWEIKRLHFKTLSYLLMRMESAIIIDGVCRYFMLHRPEMFVTSIHDCLLVRQSDAAYAKGIMEKVFQHMTGLTPMIRMEPC